MTGDIHEEMDAHSTDRLPPIVTARTVAPLPDNALSGAPLPPYRPGLYAGVLAAQTPAEPSTTWSAPAVDPSEQTAAEGWPEAWRSDPEPSAEPLDWHEAEQPAPEELELSEMLVLDEAEVQAPEPEPDPNGDEQAAEDSRGWDVSDDAMLLAASAEPVEYDASPTVPEGLDPESGTAAWDTPTLESEDADLRPWSAWDADDAAVYDLPGAAGEDTAAWQDSWGESAVDDEEPAVETPEPFEAEGAGSEFDAGPEPAEDVQEWLETGAVDEIGWEVTGGAGETVDETAASEPVAGWAHEQVADAEEEQPIAWTAEPSVETVGEGEETGEVIETVEAIGFDATLEFAPADEHATEAPADAAWAPFESRHEPIEEAPPVAEAAEPEPAAEEPPIEPADERVSIMPQTPLDSWYHAGQTEEADATWAAFGRALEEAASWGDLGATIATGLSPEEARSSPEESAAPPEDVVDQLALAETAAPAAPIVDPAVTELARRLESLAQRLREEGEKGVEQAMSEGDRLEASLAGFIAGYVAARRG